MDRASRLQRDPDDHWTLGAREFDPNWAIGLDGGEFGLMHPAPLRMVDDVDAPDTVELRPEIVPVGESQGGLRKRGCSGKHCTHYQHEHLNEIR
jgi:hypothetical protein